MASYTALELRHGDLEICATAGLWPVINHQALAPSKGGRTESCGFRVQDGVSCLRSDTNAQGYWEH